MNRRPEKPKKYLCEKCGELYGYRANLRRHHKKSHEQNPLIVCNICEIHFKSKSSLTRHNRLLHEGNENEFLYSFNVYTYRD